MPKRKRSEIEDVIDRIEDQAVRIKASRLQAKIDDGNRTLKTALDLARGFERQKMGRRQKQASKEPHKLLRLREEVIVLKELNVPKTARNYLFKQLAKTKRIKESAAFIALYSEDPKIEPPKSNAEANVLGRLFKTNPVKEVMPPIMDGIKQTLNLDDNQASSRAEIPNETTKLTVQQLREVVRKSADSAESFAGPSDEPTKKRSKETENLDKDLDETELDKYNDRLAVSADEDDNEDVEELDPMEISDVESQNHDRQNPTPSLSDLSADEKRTSQPKKSLSNEKIASSAFLPSLSMGGYFSGSDSDSDDLYDRNRGPAIPKERKNRRGQRERQRIAELKFGQKAKHLQKQQQKSNGGDARWDAKRGAVDGKRFDPRAKRVGRGGFARTNGPTGSNGDAVVGNKMAKPGSVAAKKSDGSLHPSWEAARKKKQEGSNAAFAGKKITFD